jgi:alpha-N-arabinofuranosidase
MNFKKHIVLCLISQCGSAVCAQQNTLSVMLDKPGAKIQPTMWGIFFEDINFAADGGLYAELVKNRSFEFAAPMMGWKVTLSPTIVIACLFE